jgi:ureidoacrylate peracid hydrolase
MALFPEALSAAGLLVVDMQNGFCHQEGALGRSPLPVEYNVAIIPRVAALVEAAHGAGLPVFWSRQEHTEFDAARPRHRIRTHLAKIEAIPCLRGTWDAEIVDELKPLIEDGDLVFSKHRSSCFYNTTLEVELRMRAIDTLIVTGVSTNYCVDSSIRDAYARDFDLIIVEDGCSCNWPDLHEATMKTSAIFHGEVMSTADVLELIDAKAPHASR